MSPEAIAGFAAAAVGLLGIVVTLYVRWSHRRVRVRVEVREAWRPPRWFVATLDTLDQIPTDPTVFQATVVAINSGERPVYVDVLRLEQVDGPHGFDDRLNAERRELPPGGAVSLSVDEEQVDFDMLQGVRGFVELASGDDRIYSDVLVPGPPPDDE